MRQGFREKLGTTVLSADKGHAPRISTIGQMQFGAVSGGSVESHLEEGRHDRDEMEK